MQGVQLQNVFGNKDTNVGIKKYRKGTHRSRDPQQTLEWVSPKLASMGITRIADITGLDCIGVPVTMVVRPNSRSLAVSQGKGLSLTCARVSGIMESVETYHAERINRPLKLSARSTLKKEQRVVNTDRMAKSGERCYQDHMRILWIEGIDLLTAAPVWLPFESVHTDFTLPRPTGSGFFPANTNGLASGNCLVEATAHALYEVIERDAIALWQQRESINETVVDLAGITDMDCKNLICTLSKAHINVRVWNATSDIGVPCFHCLIMDQDNLFTDAEFGSGCHPNGNVALLRAVTEAIQARTTFIAGSRDDFGSEPYTEEARSRRLEACRKLMAATDPRTDFQRLPSMDFDTMEEDLEWTLQQLVKVGIDEVIWTDLSLESLNIPVVRVVVPGLEGVYDPESGDYVAGSRARMER